VCWLEILQPFRSLVPDDERVIDALEALHEVTFTGDDGEPMQLQLFVLREIHGYEDVVKTLALFSSNC
jgi:hypothetical protein